MKRFFPILLCFLLIPSLLYAENLQLAKMSQGIAGGNYMPVASCTTSNDSKLWNPVTQPGTNGSGLAMIAMKITIESSKTITAYKVREADASGADTGNGIIRIITHDTSNNWPSLSGATPVVYTGSTSNTIDASLMSDDISSPQVDEYTISNPFILPAGTYWIMRETQNGGFVYGYYVGSTGDRVCYKGIAEETWTCVDDSSYDMELWGCN